ncbi:MAG TPA: DUF58 domain-containing protein [Mycobacteriales bacterium]|nr:DUF58 domain-containing protein [Mycobacteriales bacterium]
MTFRSAPQLTRLVALAAPLLLGALVLGRVELVVLAAPLLALGCAGLLDRDPELDVELRLSALRCLEGQHVVATVRVTASATGGRPDQVDIDLRLHPRLRPLGPTRLTVALEPGGSRDVTVAVAPTRWGVYDVGPVTVVAHGRRRTSSGWTARPGVPLRVVPDLADFRAGDAHPFHRALTGTHATPAPGEGVEFAGIRPYLPGDPLRRVHWRSSNRLGQLHVTQHRVERNAEVVLLVDTFDDVGPAGRTSLDIGVRAALGIADHYLSRGDRVGVVTFGGTTRWLVAGAGGVQRHRVVEHLLGVEVGLSYAWKDIGLLPARCLPPRALVIALSPLLDPRATTAFADLAGRGHGVVIVDTAPDEALPQARSAHYALAERIYLMEREATIQRLSEIGAPVVRWSGRGSLDAVLVEVARLHQRPRALRR